MKRELRTMPPAAIPRWTFPGFVVEETARPIYTESAMSVQHLPSFLSADLGQAPRLARSNPSTKTSRRAAKKAVAETES